MELKELLLIGANGCGNGCRDDRSLQVGGRLDGFCSAPNEELVVNILWGERVQGVAGIALEISTLRRMAQDVCPQAAFGDDGQNG
jgi:hypothetical protein